MTTKKPETPPPETDPIQSERFRKAVRDLEAAGELSSTDEAFERAVHVVVPRTGPKRS